MENNKGVYIVRHGITSWNQEKRIQGQSNNIPISKEGEIQMEILGKHLKDLHTDFIVILSPMLRARESFDILNNSLSVPEESIFIVDEMKEMNFGAFEGKLKSDVASYPFFKDREADRWSIKYPNGESYSDIFQRLNNSNIKSIYNISKTEGKSLLTIGHESINRIILQVLFPNLESNNDAVLNRQENNEIIIVKNGNRSKYNFMK